MPENSESWRKSSRCGASNTCVEVAARSACSNDSNCVEVGHAAGVVLVRDSADPDGPRLAMSRRTFAGLVAAIKWPATPVAPRYSYHGYQGRQVTEHTALTLAQLQGMVGLHIADLAEPGRMRAARARAVELAHIITSRGAEVAAPGTIRTLQEQRARREVLDAVALTIAMAAYLPGGVTWAGLHWCTAPHHGCPALAVAS